jgi:hypothetical protein
VAFGAKVGSFLLPTSGTTNIGSLGFQPKAVLFFWNARGAVGVGSTSANIGIGFATDTADRAISMVSQDALATSNINKSGRSDACIIKLTSAGLASGQATCSLGSNDFTLGTDVTFGDTMQVGYFAIGGSDVTNVFIGTITEPGATGDQDITDPGFQPDAVFFISRCSTSADATIDAHGDYMFGAAVGFTPTNAVLAGGGQDNSGTMAVGSYCRGIDQCIALFSASAGLTTNGRAAVTAWLSNGFRLNWAERTSTRAIYYIAIKGGNWQLGETVALNASATASITGLSVKPQAVLFASAARAESTSDTATTHLECSIGAGDGTSQFVFACLDEHATASSNSESATSFQTNSIYYNMLATDLIQGSTALTTLDAAGYSLSRVDADDANGYIWYVACGQGASGAMTTAVTTSAQGRSTAGANGAPVVAITTASQGTAVAGAAATPLVSCTVSAQGRSTAGASRASTIALTTSTQGASNAAAARASTIAVTVAPQGRSNAASSTALTVVCSTSASGTAVKPASSTLAISYTTAAQGQGFNTASAAITATCAVAAQGASTAAASRAVAISCTTAGAGASRADASVAINTTLSTSAAGRSNAAASAALLAACSIAVSGAAVISASAGLTTAYSVAVVSQGDGSFAALTVSCVVAGAGASNAASAGALVSSHAVTAGGGAAVAAVSTVAVACSAAAVGVGIGNAAGTLSTTLATSAAGQSTAAGSSSVASACSVLGDGAAFAVGAGTAQTVCSVASFGASIFGGASALTVSCTTDIEGEALGELFRVPRRLVQSRSLDRTVELSTQRRVLDSPTQQRTVDLPAQVRTITRRNT